MLKQFPHSRFVWNAHVQSEDESSRMRRKPNHSTPKRRRENLHDKISARYALVVTNTALLVLPGALPLILFSLNEPTRWAPYPPRCSRVGCDEAYNPGLSFDLHRSVNGNIKAVQARHHRQNGRSSLRKSEGRAPRCYGSSAKSKVKAGAPADCRLFHRCGQNCT